MSVGAEGTAKQPLKRSAATEAFFRPGGARDGRLIVVYHIQKTAGTALRHVVRRNLGEAEVELMPRLAELRHSPGKLRDWYARWYGSLDDERREQLCCVMSHLAGYLLPALDRPADALVLVREPVDRTVSYYHAKQRRRAGRKPIAPLEEIYSRDPDPDRRERWEQFFNWQSRALLSVFHDVSELPLAPDASAEVWRARLRELVAGTYRVGVQDRFDQYVAALARRYGWIASTPRSKVNPNRPAVSELSPELRRRILEANWLDAELYELCRQNPASWQT
jgi:hypothetical protein